MHGPVQNQASEWMPTGFSGSIHEAHKDLIIKSSHNPAKEAIFSNENSPLWVHMKRLQRHVKGKSKVKDSVGYPYMKKGEGEQGCL